MVKTLRVLFLIFSVSGCSLLHVQHPKEFVVEKKWARKTYANPYIGFRNAERMTPIVTENTVVQSNTIQGLQAYDRKTGALKWRLPIRNGVEGGAALVGDTLYFGASDGFFYAVKMANGQILWSFPLRSEGLGQPLVQNGVVYFVSGENILYALKADTGNQLWFYNRRDPSSLSIRGASQPTVVGDSVYVGFSDGSLVALNKDKGNVLWEKILNTNRRFRDVDAKPIVEGENLYVSGFDGALYCVNRSSGAIVWKVDEGGFYPVTIVGKTIYYSSTGGFVMALRKDSGQTIWSYKVKKGIATQPAYYKGLVVFGESSGPLKVLDAEKGTVVSEYHTGLGIMSSPFIDAETGETYFTSISSELYAMRLKWQTRSHWPWETE